MTPFGIRKKLKGLLGLDHLAGRSSAGPAEIPRYTVSFVLPDGNGYQAQAKEGDSLVLTSGRGSDPIASACADGTCGTCRVDVLEGDGQLTPETEREVKTKAEHNIAREQRLGCQAGVLGEGVKVRIVNVFGQEPVDP